ncbi:MAG TPA: methyltransferase domain-containing protein [Chitinophaga sp.]|nr:methyltransferase domain-containing protein [Chitinophaga sp.]
MFVDTSRRIIAPEIMDDLQMEGELLKETLNQIAGINRVLGGNSITSGGVRALLKKIPLQQEVLIADVGCGNGDMLRALADVARRAGRRFRLIGIDANAFTISYAKELSAEYPEITYHCMDILSPLFGQLKYDIALCTLTLHHFEEGEILQLMDIFRRNAGIGIVVNDLHRNAIAYRLFHLFGRIAGLNSMARYDGAVSILRGFKKREIKQLSQKLNINQYTLKWKWAFRYQWVISTV